ncbi:MAG: xanthine dehydrogenase family protein molybdopterin-binding subunit, partial [Dehalococcoidales bacterium]|nr:xanthine dehydrogenase family protein molybdopterin-binding subunit [Dehalococcoidales bacterium]
MPYVQYPLGKERTDHKTVERHVIDNLSVHDKSGKLIVTGRAMFTADHWTGQKYFAAPVLSTVSHANIKSIDFSEAKKLPGVIDVVTASDVPCWSNHVDCWGQAFAGVIADNWYTALRAVNLVKVEYEELPSIFDPDEAIENDGKADAVLVGNNPDSNLKVLRSVERGDLAEGFAQCDWIMDIEYPWTTSYAHNELEAHQSLAWWVGDDVYAYSGTQNVYGTKNAIVSAFKMPENRCHVYSPFNCGGFGGKTGEWGIVEACSMSKKVGGHPVLYKNTRQSNNTSIYRHFSVKSKMKVGGTNDGKILAWDAQYYSNDGYLYCPAEDVLFGIQNTWDVPNAHYQITGVLTNTPKRKYWRDVGDPPGAHNTETALDKIAYKLGMNPLDLRLKNVNPVDTIAKEGAATHWGSFEITNLLNYAAEWSDYRNKYHLPATKTVDDIYHNGDKRMHGIAISSHMDSHGYSSGVGLGAIIKAHSDGTFHVITGSARGCAGGTTVCCTVTAEVLGAKDEDVILGAWANTDVGMNAGNQSGSKHTCSIASAFFNAAMEMKWKMYDLALKKAPFNAIAGITKADLESIDSVIYYKKDHSISLPFSKVGLGNCTASTAEGYNGTNSNVTNDLQNLLGQRNGGAWREKKNDKGETYIHIDDPVRTNGQSSAVCEVAVDTATGEVEILNYYLVVDSGCSIFKQGVIRELGTATELVHSTTLFFGDIYDEATGANISSLYTEAQFPTYLDFDFSTHHFTDYQSEDAGGPFGCHGI